MSVTAWGGEKKSKIIKYMIGRYANDWRNVRALKSGVIE